MDIATLLNAFEQDRGWVNFQLQSFNSFVHFGMQAIVDEIAEIKLVPELGDLKLLLGKLAIDRPMVKEADGSTRIIFPNEARIRNLTYAAPISLVITPVINGIEEKSERVHIGNIPIMVKSVLCSTHGLSADELVEKGEDPSDPGGYFVINGTERALVLIEEIATNRPIIEKTKDGIAARINSERAGFKQRHLVERLLDGELTISFANLRRIPLVTLLRALGLETDKTIADAVSKDPRILNELYSNLYQEEAETLKEALDVIGRKLRVDEDYREERVNQILDRYLLPHLGQDTKQRQEKAIYLARIAKRVVMAALDLAGEDDIDHYGNKHLLMAGELIGQLFRSILLGRWGLLAKMSYNYQKLVKRGKTPSIQGIIEADAVTKQILSSFATGNWIGGRTGVSQRLDRSSYIKTVSHLRSIVSPLTSTQEHFRARQIHPTEWGRLCPAETPEGSSIGLRKHLAMLAEITPGMSIADNEKLLKALNV
ncbi:MAG TPA: DNA-directed RNA polymerase subunit B'' [archaeon]|nr:DNA-directed RNA polymerase subunit B'' [archaeon]